MNIVPEIKIPTITGDCFETTGICECQKIGFKEIGNHSQCIHPAEYTIVGKETGYALPEYFILHIEADTKGMGYGTKAIKEVVKKSLADPSTKGRVCLYADSITKNKNNEWVYPSGFYYKLGFRFTMPGLNEIYENWIKNGGKIELAPKKHGIMYLPKKNISQCLNY